MSSRRRQPPESCRAGVSRSAAQPGSLHRLRHQLPGTPARRRPRAGRQRRRFSATVSSSIDAVFLKYETQAPPHGAPISRVTSWPKTRALPRVGDKQRGEKEHRGGLAGAVGAQQTDQGAGSNLKVEGRRAPASSRSRVPAPRVSMAGGAGLTPAAARRRSTGSRTRPAAADDSASASSMIRRRGVSVQTGSVLAASPVRANAWHRQPPKSTAFRGQLRQGSFIQLSPRKALERLRLAPDPVQRVAPHVVELERGDLGGAVAGQRHCRSE